MSPDSGIARPVYEERAETARSRTQTLAIARSEGCATCHVSNHSPVKVNQKIKHEGTVVTSSMVAGAEKVTV